MTLSIHQADAEWNYRLNVRKAGDAGDGKSGGSIISDADGKWPNVENMRSISGVSNQSQLPVDQSPLLLLDFRAMNGNVKRSNDTDQGAMLWVGIAR